MQITVYLFQVFNLRGQLGAFVLDLTQLGGKLFLFGEDLFFN